MSGQLDFGHMERLLHRVAFRTTYSQMMLSDLEESLFRKRLESVRPGPSVFVTGLPRSGTTILLRLLEATGGFATHQYRDVPFVLCPVFWGLLSKRLLVQGEPRERAHGDGIRVSASSPEAFEEVIWKRFWPEHYVSDRIRPWTAADRDASFDAFFHSHMKKLILVRGSSAPGRDEAAGGRVPRRYLSKNNVNIARLASPAEPLAGAAFIVPFREPVQHAASMLRQHRRFAAMQSEDGFVREYMDAIGHHDFGSGLRPIDFDGWLKHAGDSNEVAFWLCYWVAAYRHVLAHAGPSVQLLSYADLVSRPGVVLTHLAEVVRVPPFSLVSQAHQLRPPRTHQVTLEGVPEAVIEEAGEVHRQLSMRTRS